MPDIEPAPHELGPRLRKIRGWAGVALLAVVIAQALGVTSLNGDVGLVIKTALVGTVVVITAYDFVMLGRRRTPSRW